MEKIILYFLLTRVEPSLQMLLEKIIKRLEIAVLPERQIPFGTIPSHSRSGKIANTWSHSTEGIYVFCFYVVQWCRYINKLCGNHLNLFDRFGELWANGLIQLWTKTYSPNLAECLINSKKKPVHPRLTLNHFAGAFVVLTFGYVLSLVVFVGERIYHYLDSRKLSRA